MKLRKCDNWGCGHYGASRGSRKHSGIDIVCIPGERAFCFNRGTVTAIGYAYGDDLTYRIVDITEGEFRWRYFYVDPVVNVGDELDAYTQIGTHQALGPRYPGITEHLHLEVVGPNGHINPEGLIAE